MPLEQDGSSPHLDVVEASGQLRPAITSDPESAFLDTVSRRVYPRVKAVRPDISLAEIRERAEQFRGVKIRGFVHTHLERDLIEQPSGISGETSVSTPPTLIETSPVSETTQPPFSSLLNRLKKPLQALGIKL